MDITGVLGLAIILFLSLLIIGGTIFSRRLAMKVADKSKFGFIISMRKRGLPFFLVACLLAAQSFAGNSTLGSVSIIHQTGSLLAGATIPIAFTICLVLTGLFYAKRLNSMSLLTLPDFFHRMYGSKAELLFSLIMIISFVVLVGGTFSAIGYILSSIFNIDFFWGVLIGAAIVVLYSFSGGIFSSVVIDTIVIIAVVASCWLAFAILYPWAENGTLSPDTGSLFQDNSALEGTNVNRGLAFTGSINWSGLIAIGLGGVMALDFTERIFSARDGNTARKGAFMAAGITLLILIPITILGIASVVLLPNVTDSFTAFPSLVIGKLPSSIGVFLLIGVLGASFTTASGAVLAMSAVISRNIVARNIIRGWLNRSNIEDRTLLAISRLFILPVIVTAFALGYLIPEPGLNLFLAFDILIAGAWAPLTFGLFWKKANSSGAIVSLVVGSLLRVVMFSIGTSILPQPLLDLGGETIIPVAASVILFTVVCVITQKKDPSRQAFIIDYVPPAVDLHSGLDMNECYRRFANVAGYRNQKPEAKTIPEEKEEKIPKQVKYIILFFYLSIGIGWIVLRVSLGVDIPFYVVSSESMVPNLYVHDLVVVKNINNSGDDSSFKHLKVGDIIVFRTPGLTTEGTHRIIVHRIVHVWLDKEGHRIIQTKGDANPESIPKLDYPIKESDYIGKVIYIIPHGGAFRKI